MDYVMGPGFGFGFGMFQIMFFIVFGLALCAVIMTLVKGITEWEQKQPFSKTDGSRNSGNETYRCDPSS